MSEVHFKGMLDYRLVFRKNTGVNVRLVGYSDANHGNEEKRTSQDGYIFLWNGTPHLMEFQKAEVRLNLHPSSRSLWTQ